MKPDSSTAALLVEAPVVRGDEMWAVQVRPAPGNAFGTPRKSFAGVPLTVVGGNFDVARDGRFLMVTSDASSAPQTTVDVLLNWTASIRP